MDNGNKNPTWFPFYVDAWLSSMKVARFTLEQRAAYLALLIAEWKSPNGILTKNDDELAFVSGLGERWKKIGRPILTKCFHKKADGYINPRLFGEWKKAQQRIEQARNAAAKRWE